MFTVYVFLFIEYFVVSYANRISLNALPSVYPLNGSRLHLICQLQEKSKFNIMWKRDDKYVGENCIAFKNFNATLQDCFHNETTTEWIIDPVTYDTRGLWSCFHGKDMTSVNIGVNVPQKLNPLKTESYSQNSIQTASGTFLNSGSSGELFLRTGTRYDPINLIESKTIGVKSFIFECSSLCASETRQLVWTSLNSTMFRKYPTFRTPHEERNNCPDGLTSAKSRALITCAVGHQQPNESPVPVDSKLSLVGLNIIYCSTDHSARISSVGSYSCINGFLNDSSNIACTYVLCDGPPPPILTSGEQTAIVIAAFLMIFVIATVCIFTWRSRKSEKATRLSQYNGTLPQSHHNQEAQMELML